MMVEFRICCNCGTSETGFSNGYAQWFISPDGYLCRRCYGRLNWKRWANRITFKGRGVYVKESPRKGRCEKCGRKIGDLYVDRFGKPHPVKRTQMHHIEYHPEDPVKDTIELCSSCHGKITMREIIADGRFWDYGRKNGIKPNRSGSRGAMFGKKHSDSAKKKMRLAKLRLKIFNKSLLINN